MKDMEINLPEIGFGPVHNNQRYGKEDNGYNNGFISYKLSPHNSYKQPNTFTQQLMEHDRNQQNLFLDSSNQNSSNQHSSSATSLFGTSNSQKFGTLNNQSYHQQSFDTNQSYNNQSYNSNNNSQSFNNSSKNNSQSFNNSSKNNSQSFNNSNSQSFNNSNSQSFNNSNSQSFNNSSKSNSQSFNNSQYYKRNSSRSSNGFNSSSDYSSKSMQQETNFNCSSPVLNKRSSQQFQKVWYEPKQYGVNFNDEKLNDKISSDRNMHTPLKRSKSSVTADYRDSSSGLASLNFSSSPNSSPGEFQENVNPSVNNSETNPFCPPKHCYLVRSNSDKRKINKFRSDGAIHGNHKRALSFTNCEKKPRRNSRSSLKLTIDDTTHSMSTTTSTIRAVPLSNIMMDEDTEIFEKRTKVQKSNIHSTPKEQKYFVNKGLTESGSFKFGDTLKVSKSGIVSNKIKLKESKYNFSHLKIVKKLGHGAFGCVHLATLPGTNMLFAVKTVSIPRKDKSMKHLISEITYTYTSDHPNIVSMYHSFTKDAKVHMIMEYMNFGSLAELVKQSSGIPDKFVAVIAKQIISGLHYLHQKGIVHRDIKPSNILLNLKGELKLCDLGVSSVMTDSRSEANKTFVGTYKYMSPERIQSEQYGIASDVWSVGIVLFECATGVFPYKQKKEKKRALKRPSDQSYWSILHSIADFPIPKLPQTCDNPDLRSFVSACMKKKSTDRYSTAELLKHPFIAQCTTTQDDLSQYIIQIAKNRMFTNRYPQRLVRRRSTSNINMKNHLPRSKRTMK